MAAARRPQASGLSGQPTAPRDGLGVKGPDSIRNPELWARLQAFRFDAGHGPAPYSVKLAAAEVWSPEYTARVIEEYRRFLYLTQVREGQATPSVAVDRAWHMHLTFTRSYWEELCGKALGAMLHHEPCAGAEEMPRYEEPYARTRAAYLREFGAPPPADIWPGDDTGAQAAPGQVREAQVALMLAPAFMAIGLILMSTGAGEVAVALFALSHLALVTGLRDRLKADRRLKNRRRRGRKDTAGCGSGGCGGGGRPKSGGSDSGDGAGGCGSGCGGGGCGGG